MLSEKMARFYTAEVLLGLEHLLVLTCFHISACIYTGCSPGRRAFIRPKSCWGVSICTVAYIYPYIYIYISIYIHISRYIYL